MYGWNPSTRKTVTIHVDKPKDSLKNWTVESAGMKSKNGKYRGGYPSSTVVSDRNMIMSSSSTLSLLFCNFGFRSNSVCSRASSYNSSDL
eukprot:scaffold2201_cov119-Cylindrotheca_fusiformis.AAC.9